MINGLAPASAAEIAARRAAGPLPSTMTPHDSIVTGVVEAGTCQERDA